MNIKSQLAKYVPVKIKIDDGLLTGDQRKLVDELVRAALVMDEIYLRQVYEGNTVLRDKLRSQNDPDLYEYFKINFGPYDRLDHDKPFLEGVLPKSKGATFYPADMKKEEFEAWLSKHPGDREAFESNFTCIRRAGADFKAVPYSLEYGDLLKKAADHLKKAAKFSDNESLTKYLNSRADAFITNDYYSSDVDWVRLKNHAIEVVIGPYEVYEDELFGYKSTFEAFVTRVDPKESEKLSKVVSFLGDLEKNLPVEDKYKGFGRSLESPIVVTQLIYTAGDAKKGFQALAFNLPNDERVRKEEGSKKVMLKNVHHAKFDKILKPIARLVMSPHDVRNTDFEAFFAHTLLHEVSHGIGPGEIEKDGRRTTVNKELKDLYSLIEEAKADTLGVYNNSYLIDRGLYSREFDKVLWPTYLAGTFRSMRFGIKEAHGGGNAIQFNYLLEKGGFVYDSKSGLFGVDRNKIKVAIRDLAHDLLMIEAAGDYDGAKKFADKYRVMGPELENALSRLNSLPVDIRPIYEYE